MTRDDIIQRTADYVKREFSGDSSGHDWHHIRRVWKTALAICEEENADPFIVQLAALLHDLDDWKFNEERDETPHRAKSWMESCGVDTDAIGTVCAIIARISFKGAGVEERMDSLEGFIVQDADRLDAIGAVGIGRAFAYGGFRNRAIFDPDSPPKMHTRFEEYRNSNSATVNHFYEKLLLLKDRMHTRTAKRIAEKRHEVMVNFLDQFMEEWNGEDLKDRSSL